MNNESINNGGPAYACASDGNHQQGMSIRTAIAAQLVAAEIQCEEPSVDFVSKTLGMHKDDWNAARHFPLYLAKRGTQLADALIAELTKDGGTL